MSSELQGATLSVNGEEVRIEPNSVEFSEGRGQSQRLTIQPLIEGPRSDRFFQRFVREVVERIERAFSIPRVLLEQPTPGRVGFAIPVAEPVEAVFIEEDGEPQPPQYRTITVYIDQSGSNGSGTIMFDPPIEDEALIADLTNRARDCADAWGYATTMWALGFRNRDQTPDFVEPLSGPSDKLPNYRPE